MSEGTRTGTTLGPYAIGRLLGRGGMGEVYLAHDEQRDRDVALKVLHASAAEDPQFRARFTRESQTVARLADPHVIPIHDFGEIDGVLYIDMRLVEGHSLAELLRTGPLPPERAVTVVEQVAGALDAAHAKGLIHRDVKPANIELTEAGFPYLLDFGLAVTDTQARMTSAGLFVGSQGYAAPERFDGDSATVASDVYSLACVLFEALTGRPPYRGDSLGTMLKQHLTAPIPRPSAEVPVPPAMDTVIARGMAKRPEDRFASCGELAIAARQALAGHGVQVRPTAPPTVLSPAAYQQPSQPQASQPRPSYPQASYPQASYPQGSYPQASYPMAPSYAAAQASARPEPKSRLVPALAAVAVVLLAVTAVVVYLVMQDSSSSSTSTDARDRTTAATESVPTGRSTEPTTPADPATALRERADTDRPLAIASENNQWVAQLSTKWVGLYADGITWDETSILNSVKDYERQYGTVRLLHAPDWPVFDRPAGRPDMWVVTKAGPFPGPDAALAWCRSVNLDNDHCFAKLISTTAGPDGTTKR